MRKFRTGARRTRQPDFDYNKYGLIKHEMPIFMIAVLDNSYMTIQEKEEFLNKFAYEYLSEEKFKLEVKDQVLIFEGNKYVGHGYRNEVDYFGNEGVSKNIINIGELKHIGIYGIKQKFINENRLMSDDTINEFKTSEHYKVNVSITHKDVLEKGYYITKEMIFDTGAQSTIFSFPEYWNYEEKNSIIPIFQTLILLL